MGPEQCAQKESALSMTKTHAVNQELVAVTVLAVLRLMLSETM
jgi:hypothetical protein